jgi:hypothetical protein
MSEKGQSRHCRRVPTTSGLPRITDILRVSGHVSKVPISEERFGLWLEPH